MSEDEFLVAADFTPYTNPVNRALHCAANMAKQSPTSSSSSSSSPNSSSDKQSNDHGDLEGDEMIASDMTKYDNPLTKIEMESFDKGATHSMYDEERKRLGKMSTSNTPVRPNYGLASKPASTHSRSTIPSKQLSK